MTDITILQANLEDLTEILQLQKQAFKTEAELHGNYDIEPLKQTYDSILSDFSTHSFLKGIYENKIIGSIKYRSVNDATWVGKLIVSPDFRRQGLGKRLLLEVEKINPETSKFQLFTAASSIQNIRLYESIGYKVCNKYKDEAQAGLEMVEMIKIIK
ncbi:MAG: GNAT family N-acetyltransferase [Dysgonomonas sp.]